jgi:hypothetical protein
MKRVFIATGIIAVLGGVGTMVLSSSCDTICTMDAKPSVIVQIVKQGPTAPEFITADGVRYEVTDSTGHTETKRAECLDDECTEWILGYEVEGTYVIHADVCGQDYSATAEVTMNEDGCHVDTQWVQIPVDASTCGVKPADVPLANPEPTQCTLEARPSVVANVVVPNGTAMVPFQPDKVWYTWSGDKGGRQIPGTCLDEECSKFAAGREQEGRFTVAAELCGQTFTADVDVGKTEDGCHVDTQVASIQASLQMCEGGPPPLDPVPADVTCTLEARPSAFIFPVTDGGDVWLPHPTEQLWYEHDDTREKAYCAEEAENGKCAWWIAGYEQAGRFKAHTESCGEQNTIEYSVEKTPDGCHVSTEFLPIFVDTKGCITLAPPPPGEPPPTGGPH